MTFTVGKVLEQGAANLAAAGIEDARREARRVIAGVLQLDEAAIVARPERELEEEDVQALFVALAKRESGQVLSRILGRREFWSMTFKVTPAVLDPRPDSETLIEAALNETSERKAHLRVLDLGTGSGCLLLALLSELPNATGLGIDRSNPALEVARENARCLNLDSRASFRQGDWVAGVEERFDIVLCNPPYISEAEYRSLDRSVLNFEPRLALVPGEIWRDDYEATGLEAYAHLLPLVVLLSSVVGAVVGLGAASLLLPRVLEQSELQRSRGLD